jgi:hypothetical protein
MSYCNSSTTFEYLDKLGMSKLKYGIAMPETKRPLKVFLCHAHADRDPVRGLPEGTRLTTLALAGSAREDGVDRTVA